MFSFKNSNNNKAMILVIVLGLIIVIIIGTFAFTGFLKNRMHYENQFILQNIGRNLSQSIVAYIHTFIQNEMNEKKSSEFANKFRKLVTDAIISNSAKVDLTELVTKDTNFNITALKQLVDNTENPLKKGRPFYFNHDDINIELSNISPLFTSKKLKLNDRIATLTVEAAIRFGSRIVKRKMMVRVKIVDVTIPVLSKFTLSVFDLPKRKDSLFYNQCLVTRIGKLSSNSSVRPLILDNSTEDGNLFSGGWIFLGASEMRDIILNKAAGYQNMGELFQFYNKSIGHPEPANISATSKPTPDPDMIGMFPDGENYLGIINNYWGFYDGMNIYDCFRKYFENEDPLKISASSFFRLYGTKNNPSRTRVIGKVFQSTPYYSILATLDPKTGKGEYTIAMLRSVISEDFLDGLIDCFVYNDPTGGAIKGSAILGWPEYMFRADRFFCGKYDVYKFFMSDFWIFPYNYNYEFMNYGPKGFDPLSVTTPTTFKDLHYLVSYDDFRLMDKKGKIYFSGNLMDFSSKRKNLLKNILEKKSVAHFNTPEGFFKTCLSNSKKLNIPGVIFIKKGPLKITQPYKIEQSGIIVVEEGDIEILSGIPKTNDNTLSLVTLSGNIIIKTNNEINASLIACMKKGNSDIGGTIKSTSTINVNGNIISEYLDPQNLKDGGKLSYDDDLDPFYKKNMGVYLEDRDMRFDD